MICQCCGNEIDIDGFNVWHGEPFTKQADRLLCFTCLSTLKPIIIKTDKGNGVAIAGTSSGDIYSLQEMLNDGFDKERSIQSIKKISAALGLPPSIVKQRLKISKKS